MQKSAVHENPRATIAILCPNLFFANAYRGLLDYLPEAEIVPDFSIKFGGKSCPEPTKQAFRSWLLEKRLPWRDIEQEKLTPEEFFSKYGTVVGPYYGGWVRSEEVARHRKVRVFYGAAKDLWGFSLWNTYFDLICTPGPYFTDTLEELYGRFGTRIVSTGEPKLDALTTTTREEARESLGITSSLPVVLVSPTYGRLSCLEKIAGSLISLSDQYTIVVKAHHRTSTFFPESLEVFNGTAVRVIDESVPVPIALQAADVMVSDGSGAIFDALRADKPVVIIDIVGEPIDEFPVGMKQYDQTDERQAGTTTYARSTDQRIKKPGEHIGPIVDLTRSAATAERVADAVQKALAEDDTYAANRQRLMDSHFTRVDGKAAERIAHEIKRIAQAECPHSVQQQGNLFPALVDDFLRRMKQEGLEESAAMEEDAGAAQKIRYLKSLPSGARMRAVIHEFFD
jgi:hypothetical protein